MKRLLGPLVFLLITSCGYQSPEEDKHPDVPIFPKHTNSAVEINPFSMDVSSIHFNEKYYFGYNQDDFLILDPQFNVIKKISEKVFVEQVTAEGDVFFFETSNDNVNRAFVFSAPKFAKKEVDIVHILPRNQDVIKDSLLRIYQGKIDTSKVSENYFIDSLLTEVSKKNEKRMESYVYELKNQTDSFFVINDYWQILYIEGDIIALTTSKKLGAIFKESPKSKQCKKLSSIKEKEQSPPSFDKVVLGNTSSGNHLVVSYHPYGYNYINLKVGSEETKFKVKNEDNGDGVKILYQSTDSIVLKDDFRLYSVTLK